MLAGSTEGDIIQKVESAGGAWRVAGAVATAVVRTTTCAVATTSSAVLGIPQVFAQNLA